VIVAHWMLEEDSLSSASVDQRANTGAQCAKAQYTVSVSVLVDIEQRIEPCLLDYKPAQREQK